MYHPGSDIQYDKYDESIWSDTDKMGLSMTYYKSKTLAEKAAWDYIEELKTKGEYAPELVTILPGFVVGKTKISTGFSSGDIFRKMLLGKLPIAKLKMPYVDV